MSWIITPSNLLVDDQDALTYLTAVETADGQALESGVRLAVNAFVKGCKADGIWPAMEIASIFNGARTRLGSYIDLKSATQIVSNTGTDLQWTYDRKTGLKGDASNTWLNTNRAENADGQDNSHVAVYVLAAPTATAIKNFIGAGVTDLRITSTNALLFRSRNSTSTSIGQAGSTLGLLGASRDNGANFQYKYGANAIATANTASTAPGTTTYGVFSTNSGGSKTDAALGFYSVGKAINLDLLAARVTTLIQAIDAAI
jgi:hypothetical protein